MPSRDSQNEIPGQILFLVARLGCGYREIIDVSVRDLTRSAINIPKQSVLPMFVKSPVEPKSIPPVSVPEPSDECKDLSNDSTCTFVEKPLLRRSTRIAKPRTIMDL